MSELAWRAGLDEVEIVEVDELARAATVADGTAPLAEHVVAHLRPGAGEAAHLLARTDGALVAVAHLDLADGGTGPASGELVVHPAHRRAGLGTRLVSELLTTVPAGGTVALWAHGEHPGAVAIAARLGFSRSRVLWQMRRSLLEPFAAAELPPGVALRPFVVGADEAEFLRVNNAAFDWHPEQGGWGLDQIELREAEPWFEPAGFLLAVDGSDRLLGYHWTKVHAPTGSNEEIGEVYVLGVDPAARGMHLGSALTLAGLRHLRDRGLTEVMLYVESDNHAAVGVYRDLGFTVWHTDVLYVR